MSQPAAEPQVETGLERDVREGARAISGDWWVWLIAGILWIVVSLVILQFDNASITTVGILVGVMFMLAGVQSIAFTAVPGAVRWVSLMFGALFLIAAIVCFVNPASTFAALAEIIGFLFLIVGVWWMIRAFLERPLNPLWWLGLIAGILMVTLAFWAAGQFFIEKAYVLLVFAGIWALMEGTTDIARAFALSELHEDLRSARR